MSATDLAVLEAATPLSDFDTLLREAEIAHGHLCAGQILGVRMAMLGCRMLDIEDPRGVDRKRLVTVVEIDRCATDAIGVVTGCRLGKRALKLRDWGKMAATFIDLKDELAPDVYRGVRVAALESSKDRARELYPDIEPKNHQQMLAYRELADAELFSTESVAVPLPPREFPGYKSGRVRCDMCGEGINYDREVRFVNNGSSADNDLGEDGDGVAEQVLCQGCAAPAARYYQSVDGMNEIALQRLSTEAANKKTGATATAAPACKDCM
jgi:formylmethanofuran dehydrogenase subunit E